MELLGAGSNVIRLTQATYTTMFRTTCLSASHLAKGYMEYWCSEVLERKVVVASESWCILEGVDGMWLMKQE